MGFITTIIFHNDAYEEIESHPKEVVQNILEAMNSHEDNSFSIGDHCNPMKSMGASHADVNRLFLQHGNTLFELGSKKAPSGKYKKELIKIAEDILKYYKRP